MGKTAIFFKTGAETTGHPHGKMNVGTDPAPFTKSNSKCITDINVKCKTNKFL